MFRKMSFAVVMIALLSASASAGADALEPLSDRPLTLKKGQFHVGADADVQFFSDGDVQTFMLGTRYLHDRRRGVSVGYGILDQLEIGLDMQDIGWSSGNGADFGGMSLHATYAFLSFLGVELQIMLPPNNISDNRVWIDLGIPFRYTIVKGLLAVFVRPDITFRPIKNNFTVDFFADYGLTFSFTPKFFFELYSGIGKQIKPSGTDVYIPLGFKVGGTIADSVDLAACWNLLDLNGADWDVRSIGLSADFWF